MDVLSIEFDKVYLVQKKRISLGWTAAELSFLLGYRKDKVCDIENPLGSLRYDSTETNQLRRIFFNCKLSEIMSPKIAVRYFRLEIFTQKKPTTPEDTEDSKGGRKKREICSFEIHILDKNLPPRHFLSFTQGKDDFKIDFREFVSPQIISTHIDELFNGSFFNVEKTAFEIFESCVKKHGRKVRPCHIMDVIGKYTGRRKAPRLVKGKNEMRRQTYIKDK